MRSVSFLLLLFFCIPCPGADLPELAGDLPKVLYLKDSPYLVVADVFVPAGKVVKIEPGTVLLFKNFTGVHVQGVLMVPGTGLNPVIFTSENDPSANPASKLSPTPYDWNGIYIHKDGIGSDLQNIQIMYSVKGIVSETRFIRLSHCVFKENGRSNLSIEGEEKEVIAGRPFSHSVSVKDAAVDGVPIRILQDPEAPKRNFLRYGGLTAAVGGVAQGGFFAYKLKNSQREMKTLSGKDLENLTSHVSDDWEDARSRRNRNLALTITGFFVAALGAAGFTWSFNF